MTTEARPVNLAKPQKSYVKMRGGDAFVILLIITFTACSKETQTTEITGKWKGTMSIWKRTTYMNGIISSEGSDTTDWTKPGYSTSLEFSGDSVALYYSQPSYLVDYRGLKYVFNADKLKFYNNPFSYRSGDPRFGLYLTLPVEQRDICSVTELTTTKLVLYDKDTINRNPLIVWQQWNTFIK
jgi:hypothetical protein